MNAITHPNARKVNDRYPDLQNSLTSVSRVNLNDIYDVELKHAHQYLEIAIEHELSQANKVFSEELHNYLEHYIESLTVALKFNDQALFQYETRWLFSVLTHHSEIDINEKVKQRLTQAISSNLSSPLKERVLDWLDPIEPIQYREDDSISLSIEDESYNWNGLRERLLDLLFDLKVEKAKSYARCICDEIGDLRLVYENLLRPALTDIGRKWEHNQISIAQEHIASNTIEKLMHNLFQNKRDRTSNQSSVSILVTNIQGNQHTYATQMLSDAFELEGWTTISPGGDLPRPEIIQLLKQADIDILTVSCTLSKHIPQLAELIRTIRETEGLQSLSILVGGLPFLVSSDLFKKIDADGAASNIEEAISWIESDCETDS